MEGLSSDEIFRFNGLQLDRRGLYRLDSAERIPLGSRALDILALLIRRKGALVSKEEIMATVWRGRKVVERNVDIQVSKLRRVLEKDRPRGSCIRTVTGYGYSFTADATPVNPEALIRTTAASGTAADESDLVDIITAGAEKLRALAESQQQIIDALQVRLVITERLFVEISKVALGGGVPLKQLRDKVIEVAEAFKKALGLPSTSEPRYVEAPSPRKFCRTQIDWIRDRATRALEPGQLVPADQLLEELQRLQVVDLAQQDGNWQLHD